LLDKGPLSSFLVRFFSSTYHPGIFDRVDKPQTFTHPLRTHY
jgi:hypothetical protein